MVFLLTNLYTFARAYVFVENLCFVVTREIL